MQRLDFFEIFDIISMWGERNGRNNFWNTLVFIKYYFFLWPVSCNLFGEVKENESFRKIVIGSISFNEEMDKYTNDEVIYG